MTCHCHNKLDRSDGPHAHLTQPNEFCPYCAEKHLGTAAALAREHGYEAPNLGYIIGEMVCAAWHLLAGPPEARALADAVRDARHAIQDREGKEKAIDWEGLVRSIDSLINVQIAREKKAPEAAGKAEQ